MQAAMGLQQLDKLPTIHSLRRRNYALLFAIYEKYEEYFHLPRAQEGSDPSWFAFPLTIKAGAPFSRGDIVDYLEENLIQTRPYFAGNIMLQPAYTHLMDPVQARDNYPYATHAMTHSYFHGTSPVITPEQIKYIGTVVDNFMSLII
jgi:CDP-6-deoxy-D-xylo-4-hexulose-3-dehydrase